MNRLTKVSIILVTILGCAGCDQATKIAAKNILQDQSPISFLSGIFTLTYAENTGAMLSLGGNLTDNLRYILFVIFVGLFLFSALAYVIYRPMNILSVFGFSLFIGGGLSNLLDRVFNDGAVVDFMYIRLGAVETGIFNVADMAIMAGAFLLCYTFTKLEAKPE